MYTGKMSCGVAFSFPLRRVVYARVCVCVCVCVCVGIPTCLLLFWFLYISLFSFKPSFITHESTVQ